MDAKTRNPPEGGFLFALSAARGTRGDAYGKPAFRRVFGYQPSRAASSASSFCRSKKAITSFMIGQVPSREIADT